MARQQQAQRIAQQQRQTQSVQQEQNARQAAYQAANQKRNGALATDPKKTEPPKFKYEENQAAYGGLNERQQSRYNAILRNKGRAAANKFLQTASGGQVVMPGGKRVGQPAGPQAPTPESVTEEGFMGAGAAYQDMVQQFRDFDPMQMQQQYEQVYSQEMDRARQNVMGQFERRNAEEFERQNIDLQRQIAERGLDPNSPAAQALMKQNSQRQDLARQEAMSAAEQAASSVQQQMFGQAYQTGMMPYEQWQAIQQPYITGIGAQYQSREAQLQRQFEEAMRKGDRASAERIARMSRSGGGGGQAGPSLYERMEAANLGQGAGQQQPNPWAGAASGFAQGVGAGITNWALK